MFRLRVCMSVFELAQVCACARIIMICYAYRVISNNMVDLITSCSIAFTYIHIHAYIHTYIHTHVRLHVFERAQVCACTCMTIYVIYYIELKFWEDFVLLWRDSVRGIIYSTLVATWAATQS